MRFYNAKTCKKSHAGWFLSAASLLLVTDVAAQGYVPPPLPNRDIDPYGLETKNGRFNTESVTIVAVGDESSRLKISFSVSDFSHFVNQYYGIVFASDSESAISVEFGRFSERFSYNGSFSSTASQVAFQPQLGSGSTLYRNYNGSVYQYVLVLKDNTQVYYTPGSNVYYAAGLSTVSYPNGYQIKVTANSIRDSRGFEIQTVVDGQGYTNYQGINNTVDYCADSATALCSVSSTLPRVGKDSHVFGSTWDHTIADPTGAATTYRFGRMRFQISPGSYIDTYLPVAIDLPGGGADEITLSYNYGQPNVNTIDDVFVTGIVKGSGTTTYSYVKTGIASGAAVPGFNLTVSGFTGGIKQYTAYSIKPPSSSSTAPRAAWTALTYTDGLGNQTSFQPDKFGNTSGANYPGGSFISNTFDARNNYLTTTQGGSNVPSLITTRAFPSACSAATQATCNEPSSITDPAGNRTDYTYNALGQLLTVSLPAPTVGGTRPTTTYTYVSRTAYIKDAGGNPVAAGPPISLIASVSSCRSSASCSGTSDETLTQYDYGPSTGLNNLLVRGVVVTSANSTGQSEARRTCYLYNYFGEKIAETKPKAGLTSCN